MGMTNFKRIHTYGHTAAEAYTYLTADTTGGPAGQTTSSASILVKMRIVWNFRKISKPGMMNIVLLMTISFVKNQFSRVLVSLAQCPYIPTNRITTTQNK